MEAGREHHLRAEEAHQLAALDRKALGHRDDQRVALGGADHGEPDAGVAGGRFDHRLAGLQLAGFLGRLDDAEGQAILDRAQRIERLDLDVKVDALGAELVDPDYGGVAHRAEDAVVFHGRFSAV